MRPLHIIVAEQGLGSLKYIRWRVQWTMERWNEELEATDVMVMTADIFRNVLHRAYIKMERVNLVIFDEAHHARKNHSYNQIMANHYQQCPVQLRPKIFGMTASPTFGKESSHNSIKQLEVNLASKAFTVAPEDMTAHVRRPEESIVYYKNGPFPNPPPLYYLIANPKVAGPAMELLAAPLNESLAFCEELGPWCAERALEQAIVDADIRMQRKAFQRKHNAHLRVDVDEAKEDAILTNVANIKNYILRSAHWGSNAPPPTVKTLSPKVIALIKVLEEYRDEADRFCGIIFVERRATANVLHKAIKKWKGLAFLKSEVLVGHGHGSGNPVDINMSVQQQKQVVQAFQEGRANLLIATRVAEEGLDIKACMLVIRYVDYFGAQDDSGAARCNLGFLGSTRGEPSRTTSSPEDEHGMRLPGLLFSLIGTSLWKPYRLLPCKGKRKLCEQHFANVTSCGKMTATIDRLFNLDPTKCS